MTWSNSDIFALYDNYSIFLGQNRVGCISKYMDLQKYTQRVLSDAGVKIWIRHVIVPGVTLEDEGLRALGQFMAELKTLSALDVLPYHTMGIKKYKELEIPYPLEGVAAATKEQAQKAREVIMEALREELVRRRHAGQ